MVEYDFNVVSDFWDRVYEQCDLRGVSCNYGDYGENAGNFKTFLEIVEQQILELAKIKY